MLSCVDTSRMRCYVLTVSLGDGCSDTAGLHLQPLFYPAFRTSLAVMVNWLTLGEERNRHTSSASRLDWKLLFLFVLSLRFYNSQLESFGNYEYSFDPVLEQLLHHINGIHTTSSVYLKLAKLALLSYTGRVAFVIMMVKWLGSPWPVWQWMNGEWPTCTLGRCIKCAECEIVVNSNHSHIWQPYIHVWRELIGCWIC